MRHKPTKQEIEFAQSCRFGRLATADATGVPSIVPVCFTVIDHQGDQVIAISIDEKPKSGDPRDLKRLRNVRENPAVSLLVDIESERWDRLAFVHLRGVGRIVEPGDEGHDAVIGSLRTKYVQYQSMRLEEMPQIWITELEASSWSGGSDEGLLPRPGGLTELIQGRRSVRAFRQDPIPTDVIRQAISAAGWAPSPHGRQPWRFAVVQAEERRRALADRMADSWLEQLMLDRQSPEIVEIRLQKSRQRLIETPILVVPCLYLADLDVYPDAPRQEAEETMAIQSLGAAIQNFLLTIYAAGLDSGWMCAPLFCPNIVSEVLGLDEALIPHALLPVGYAAKDPVRRERMPVDDLIVGWT
jgi:coenzyme F420-0:L-glutamate ligase / coenzyme F420-1:gamma-L-glutamate ligase